MREERSPLEKLTKIDRRWIFLLIFIVMGVPILYPVGLPISVSEMTNNFWDTIDGLPPGSMVVVSFDWSAACTAEQLPQAKAIFEHLGRKDAKIIAWAFWADGPVFADKAFTLAFGSSSDHPDYGKKFINLGYFPGGETAMAALASDIHGTATQDFYNNPIETLEMMNDVKSVQDIDLYIDMVAGTPGLEDTLRQFQGKKPSLTMLCAVLALWLPSILPYYPMQVKGLLSGMKGAAEYELLLRSPWKAIAGMDAQSLGHLFLIALIVIGNIGYFSAKKR